MIRRVALLLLIVAALVGGVGGAARADVAAPCAMMDGGDNDPPCPQSCPAVLCPVLVFAAPVLPQVAGGNDWDRASRLVAPDILLPRGQDPPPDHRPPIS